MNRSVSRLVRASFLMSAMPSFLTGQERSVDDGSAARRMGSWGVVIELPTHPEQMAVLPSGKVLMWPWAPERRTPPHGPLALWSPEDGRATIYRGSGIESASGLAFQPDGVLLSAGGDLPDGGIDGNARAFVFDHRMEELREVEAMQGGRVFPSATTLPSGEILVSGGLDQDHEINAVPVLWDGATWTTLPKAYNDESRGPTFQFVAPDGRLFRAGPEPLSDWLDVEAQAWIDMDVAARNEVRYQGTGVMYDVGKILLVGGCPAYRCEQAGPVATAEVIDLQSDPPVWRKVGAMSTPRHSHHATLLPDGTVLVTGGTDRPNVFNGRSDGILAAELWDPVTESFEPAASMTAPRHFQSAAVLLHDGRVLVAGGAFGSSPDDATFASSGQIYSPPYLHRGARPRMAAVPSAVRYGERFTVETPDAASISAVALVALSAASQGWNGTQRRVRLDFATASGMLQVEAPGDPSLAPPGFYLLFILDDRGVPSVGRPLRIRPRGDDGAGS